MNCKSIGEAHKEDFVLEYLKFTAASAAQDNFPAEVGAMLPIIYSALCKLFARLKAKGTDEKTSIKAYHRQCLVDMEPSDFNAVDAVTDGSYSLVGAQLKRLA